MGEVEKEAQAVTGLIKGVKILVPFVISIASVVGVYYTIDARVAALEKDNASIKTKIKEQGETIRNHDRTLIKVTTDIQHIKDDTEETLNLVRALYRQR